MGQNRRQAEVQTFFASDGCHYFVVTAMCQQDKRGLTPLTIDYLVEAMLEEARQKDMEEDEQLGIVDMDQHMVDRSPWMDWQREFTGKDMVTIVKKSWRPT